MARIKFYSEFGSNLEDIKWCKKILSGETDVSPEVLNRQANRLTPKLTLITNVEYPTMRKMSKSFPLLPLKDNSKYDVAKRIYDYIDNRMLITDYLTHSTLRLVQPDDQVNKSRREYVGFWDSLRKTKMIDCKLPNKKLKLIREYTRNLCKDVVKRKMLKSAITLGFYTRGMNEDDVLLDCTEALLRLNDNDIHQMKVSKIKKSRQFNADELSGMIEEYTLHTYQIVDSSGLTYDNYNLKKLICQNKTKGGKKMMNLTMQQAIDDFLIYKSATCVDKTIEYYQANLHYFLIWYAGKLEKSADEIMLEEVTNKVLNEYLIYLRNKPLFEGHPIHGGATDAKLSNNTIRTYQRALRVFLNYCYTEEYIDTDISKKFKFIRETQSIVLPLYDTEVTDVDAMFNPKCRQGIRNLCLVHLMLAAGLRSGEVIRLHIGDVDFNKNILFIKDSKFDKSRLVPMGMKLKQYLHKYLIIYRGVSENQSYNIDLKKDPFFLEVKSQKPITGDVVRCLFSRIKRNTDISRIYPHLLRHTFATSYILGGGNLESLRLLMGHSDIVTTQKYVHLAHSYQMMHPDVYKLDKVFFRTYY